MGRKRATRSRTPRRATRRRSPHVRRRRTGRHRRTRRCNLLLDILSGRGGIGTMLELAAYSNGTAVLYGGNTVHSSLYNNNTINSNDPLFNGNNDNTVNDSK